jgi:hypothetical protein
MRELYNVDDPESILQVALDNNESAVQRLFRAHAAAILRSMSTDADAEACRCRAAYHPPPRKLYIESEQTFDSARLDANRSR